MKPKAVLAYCREKGIRAVDLRFMDLSGTWRHVTFPVAALTESSFESGFGHQVLPTGFSSDMPKQVILIPISQANYLDPLVEQPTLVILAGVQDIILRESSELDCRAVAQRALNYFESTGIGDGVSIRATHQIRFERSNQEPKLAGDPRYLACGPSDVDFGFRCDLASLAAEAGITIEKHYLGINNASEIVLSGKGLLEACDDLTMLGYLAESLSQRRGLLLEQTGIAIPSFWQLLRGQEGLFNGASNRGLSETGHFALGGLMKHVTSIVAIACSGQPKKQDSEFRWLRVCSESVWDAITQIAIGSHNPRTRLIEFRGVPGGANPYLVFSAVLMAMIDGIQNKVSCDCLVDHLQEDLREKMQVLSSGKLNANSIIELSNGFEADMEFLTAGNVFSENTIRILIRHLREAT